MPTRAPLALSLAVALAGCAAGSSGSSQTSARVVAPSVSTTLIDAEGKDVGTASIVQSSFGGVLVLKLTGLPPGPHGLHVHSVGSCEPPAFTSAGPHLNPDDHQHGARNPKGPHLGDLPNITARPDGNVDTTLTLRAELLKPGVIGSGANARALVVHAKADDAMTDPGGNSGDRIACGVLQR